MSRIDKPAVGRKITLGATDRTISLSNKTWKVTRKFPTLFEALLQETRDYLLQETGDLILINQQRW